MIFVDLLLAFASASLAVAHYKDGYYYAMAFWIVFCAMNLIDYSNRSRDEEPH